MSSGTASGAGGNGAAGSPLATGGGAPTEGGAGPVAGAGPNGSSGTGEPAGAAGTGPAAGGTTSEAGAGGGGGGATEPVSGVVFSTPSQSFRDSLSVELTTTVAGAEIRYTTDGTVPSASSTLYAGTALALTATTQLRTQAFVAGAPSGAGATGIYVARTFDATSALPILILDGYGGGLSTDKETYLDAAVLVFEPVDGVASLANLPTLATRAGYHLRGQSSSTFEQRPYRLELWDAANDDQDLPLLGMPEDSDWAILPPFYDRSLIRTPLTYLIGKSVGLEAPNTAFAEVYVNYEARALAETDYQGIYWVSELIKNSKERLNLQQLEETDTALPDLSGGYIFKFEQFAAEEPLINCTGADPIAGMLGGGPGGSGGAGGGGTDDRTCWHSLELADPSPANAEQMTWITQYIQEFHDSLHTTPIGDYGSHIEVASFVDYFLLTELSQNLDAYVRSAYYFKDRDGKINAGPLWDYNFAYGAGTPDGIDPALGWRVDADRNVNNWFPKLLTDSVFREAVKARWAVVRPDQFSVAAIDEHIATLTAPLNGALTRDTAKWPISFFIERAERSTVPIEFPTDDTFEGQLASLRAFISARLTRMDALVDAL